MEDYSEDFLDKINHEDCPSCGVGCGYWCNCTHEQKQKAIEDKPKNDARRDREVKECREMEEKMLKYWDRRNKYVATRSMNTRVFILRKNPADIVVMCSDGLWTRKLVERMVKYRWSKWKKL